MYIFLLSSKIENALYGILMVNNSILSISITDSGATQRQRYSTGDSFFHDKRIDKSFCRVLTLSMIKRIKEFRFLFDTVKTPNGIVL